MLEEARAKLGTYADALALDHVRSPRARALGWSPTLSERVTANVPRLLEEYRTQRQSRRRPLAGRPAYLEETCCLARVCSPRAPPPAPRAAARRQPDPQKAKINSRGAGRAPRAAFVGPVRRAAHRRRAAASWRRSISPRRWPRSACSPPETTARSSSRCRSSRSTVERRLHAERAGQHLSILPRRRRVLGHREAPRAGAGGRRVRRLRHQRAGAEVERLRRAST